MRWEASRIRENSRLYDGPVPVSFPNLGDFVIKSLTKLIHEERLPGSSKEMIRVSLEQSKQKLESQKSQLVELNSRLEKMKSQGRNVKELGKTDSDSEKIHPFQRVHIRKEVSFART
jgi:hypothetical protein